VVDGWGSASGMSADSESAVDERGRGDEALGSSCLTAGFAERPSDKDVIGRLSSGRSVLRFFGTCAASPASNAESEPGPEPEPEPEQAVRSGSGLGTRLRLYVLVVTAVLPDEYAC
jgi:hypothetical protein